MKRWLLGIVAIFITSCIPVHKADNYMIQRMPSVDADYAVYAGCVRAVAMLTIRTHVYWSESVLANYCEEVVRSFHDDQPPRELGGAM